MHPVKQAIGGGAVFVVALGVAAGAGSLIPSDGPVSQSLPASVTTQTISHCAEDDPCWTWSRMGDRRRGVIDLSTGQRVVVGPCTFRHMWMNGNADLSRASDRMRGDWWAIHHGCDRRSVQALHANGLPEPS